MVSIREEIFFLLPKQLNPQLATRLPFVRWASWGTCRELGTDRPCHMCSVAGGGLHVPFPLLEPSVPGGKREMISVAFSLEK